MPWDLVWKLFLLKKYLQVSWTVHETHHFSAKRWKMKMLYELLNVSFSLFDTKWKCPKNSHWESFLKKKNGFYEWRTMNYYTLLNRHSVSVITVMHRLTDLKIKIIKGKLQSWSLFFTPYFNLVHNFSIVSI